MILKVLQYNPRGVNRWLGVKHHVESSGRRQMMKTCRREWETFHWGMQASKYWGGGIPRSTSWIMSWSRQEVIRHRRALMNPTSVTRKGANDFWRWKLTDDMEDGGHEMNEGWRYVVGGTGWTLWISWTYNDTDWWTGSITPKWMVWVGPWCYRWMKTTQPDMKAERECHVQEWLATNKFYSSSFPFFPSHGWPVPLYFCQAWGG